MISAPVDEDSLESRDLALALANRSAVLFSLKAYNLALDDIRLALESGYPKELRYKLLERKVNCGSKTLFPVFKVKFRYI